jgi:lysozyme family protein
MYRRFPAALSAVLKEEGGYVDNPSDPGGATNMGITRKTLAAWRKVVPYTSLPKSAVKALTPAEAGEIYRANYWNVIKGDQLPDGLDYAVFDFAVNSGPGRAAKVLQGILGVAADGQIGPDTLSAAGRANVAKTINELCDQRMAFLAALPTYAVFGNGWKARVGRVRTLALQMAGSIPAPAPTKPAPAPQKPANKAGLIIVAVLVIAAIAFFIIKH